MIRLEVNVPGFPPHGFIGAASHTVTGNLNNVKHLPSRLTRIGYIAG